MDKQLIAVGSITHAMKGREILLKNGIAAYIERIPVNKKTQGCGYRLYVPKRTEEAVKILNDNKIRITGISEREMPP